MSRVRNVFAAILFAGFTVGATACVDMEDEPGVDGDDAVYLEPADEAYVPDEPLRAVVPPDPDTGDVDQPDATLLETAGEYIAPAAPLTIAPPDPDDDDDTTDGSSYDPAPRRQ